MYCPNCGTDYQAALVYCRSCGLKLDEISRNVAEQFPSPDYAAAVRRKERFDMLGLCSLVIASITGLSMILYKVGSYKAELFGPATLFWSAVVAFAVFGMLAVFFFNYPKKFMNLDGINRRLEPSEPARPIDTQKIIEDRVFEHASVTENPTELLANKKI